MFSMCVGCWMVDNHVFTWIGGPGGVLAEIIAILDWRDQTYFRLELSNGGGLLNSPELGINHFHTKCMMQTRQDRTFLAAYSIFILSQQILPIVIRKRFKAGHD